LGDSAPPRRWVELSLFAAPEAVDAVAEVFRSHGVTGVAVEEEIAAGGDEGFDRTGASARILAYVPDGADAGDKVRRIEEGIWHLRAFDLAPMSPVTTRLLDEEDWATAWKEHFHPLRVGRRIVVKPTWRDYESSAGDVVIELDPGMAFGTGLHPTTRMMLEVMETSGVVTTDSSVLDVGTGSGILAIAAAKLGARRIVALDVEAVAVDVATENVSVNEVSDVVTVAKGSIDDSEETFDVIFANIIATVIADMVPDFAERMTPASTLLVSGIIDERAHLVADAFERSNIRIAETRRDGDWICHTARLRPPE
jgi:ribosomal protein L11 methyltransferase